MILRTIFAAIISAALVAPQVAFAEQPRWQPVPSFGQSTELLQIKCKPGQKCKRPPHHKPKPPIHKPKPPHHKPPLNHRPPHHRPPWHHVRPPHFRPFYRHWMHRPYYGVYFGGITLGLIIATTREPVPPSPYICWYWANPAKSRGYWDYCY